jgi:hypothetical protein
VFIDIKTNRLILCSIIFIVISLPVFKMAPKKREKELDKNRIDHAQADHELFLQAFESKLNSYLNGYMNI